MSTEELIAKIKSGDDNERGDAWQNAGAAGPAAVKPLAQVMAEGEMEVSRSARRALWKIVYHVGRPGADAEKKPVLAELVDLLGADRPDAVRREALWMLSELSDGGADVDRIVPILSHKVLREDARMALERIPGERSLGALKKALGEVPEDFQINIAQALRARGVEVPGHPCQKLVPAKETKVKTAAK